MKDFFKVNSSALPDNTRVGGFRGTEGISRLYEFEIFLLMGAEGQDLDLADAIGAKATLELHRDDDRPHFVFNGIFSAFELLHEIDNRSLFRATLVPQLWQLTQTFHSRIFTGKSIPDILKEVLEDGGLSSSDYALKLSQDYKPQEHVCQYQESHFDFISRWMEREGMYYYFEQGDSSEKLIITDSKSYQAKLEPKAVRFYPMSGHDGSSGEALHSFTCRHRALPASVKLKDYDYTKPTLDVSGTAPVSKVGIGEISTYGTRFFTPDEGKKLAKTRAEELLTRQVVYVGSGTAYYLRPGYLFELEDHPRAAFDITYLVTDAEHVGNQAISSADLKAITGIETNQVYRVEIKAIPSSVQYRPESKTAWPRIYGFENGTVCGPAESDYAQIDDHGRYNVKFKFDESDLKDGKASTWVRMLQPHGGSPEGWHFPLRKATEVLFTFQGGDPDRPVIAGVVPNAHTPSPVTRANHATNVIQTGGRNRLELEDTAGQQRITLQTPHTNTMIRMGAPNDEHNMIIRTDGKTLLDAGGHWDVTVGGHLSEDVKGPVDEKYHSTRETLVHGDADEKWDATLTSNVTGETKQTYVANHEITSSATRKDHVVGACTELYDAPVGRTYGSTLEETISGGVSLTHGATMRTVKGTLEDTATGAHTLTTGARTDHVKGDLTQNVDGTYTQTTVNSTDFWTGAKSSHTYGLSNSINVGAKVSLNISASAEANLSAVVSVSAGIKMEAKASLSLTTSAAIDIKLKSIAFDQDSLLFKTTAGCELKNIGTTLHCAAICIFS